jgi:hypothetical protein
MNGTPLDFLMITLPLLGGLRAGRWRSQDRCNSRVGIWDLGLSSEVSG